MALSLDEEVLAKLDLILRVLSLQVGADKSLTERVRLLRLAGVDNKTIAAVLNTTPEAVRALSSASRSTSRPKGASRATSRRPR